MRFRSLHFLGACALLSATAFGQIAQMPAQTGTFTGNTRGYYFTAPCSMTITGVNVLAPSGGANTFQNYSIVRFDNAAPPPNFPMLTNAFTTLATGLDLTQGAFQPEAVAVSAGDVIGIYGNTAPAAGTTNGTNSYSNLGGAPSTVIAGVTVGLTRSGMQMHLGSAATPNMQDIWAEPAGINISRVEFTYTVTDKLVMTDCLPGAFIDISTTGTPLSLSDDGEVDIATTVGNGLLAAGTARVGSNGAVRFDGAGQNLGFTNETIPSMAAFDGDQTLMPFWDDVNTAGGTNGEIYWEEVGGTLIVQWQDVDFFGGGVDVATFQLQVPSSGPAFAQFVYTDIEGTRPDGGASATIGYQAGATGTGDAQYTFNAPHAVRNGTVLSLTSPTAAVFTDQPAGTWIDISGTGVALSLSDDGEADIPTTIGNAFFPAGTARVGSNGAVRFDGAGQNLGFTNETIPSMAAFDGDQTLMPFWDDVNTAGGTNGEIYWEEVGNTLVVQWDGVDFFGGAVDTATFQLQVHDSGPVFAQFLYQDISGARAANGDSATIGYQGGAISGDAPYSFNTASVGDGTVLSLVGAASKIGAAYCNANPNSTGVPGVTILTGSRSVAENDLRLVARQLPLNAFGFFITSDTAGFTPLAGGSMGNICLGGNIGRFVGPGQVQNSGAGGGFALDVDLTLFPTPTGFVAVQPGETWNFQAWTRDSIMGVADSNLTSAVQVTFLP